MAFILQNSDDRRIQVGGEELLRPLSIGTNWTRLRVGYRLRLNASFTIPAGILMVGLCQGAQGFLSPSTTDYLGMEVGNIVSGVIWSMTTTGAYPYVVMGNNSITYRKVASVITTQTTSGSTTACINTFPTGHSHLFLDVTKGSPNYTMNLYAMPSASGPTDVTRAAFFTALETDTAVASLNSLTTTPSFAYSGSGLFDTISFYWNRTAQTMEISDIAVARYL